MKEVIVRILQESLKEEKINFSKEEIEKNIEIPPSSNLGDFAFPCFFIASKTKQNPKEVALQIRKNIGTQEIFESIQTIGPYINFFVDRKKLALNLIEEILSKKEKFGKSDLGKGKKVMVEFVSPNTNKPLHIGHLRNMAIGESISRIINFNNSEIIRASLNNDRGIHICKSMLAYQNWGKNKKPTIKPDHFVGKYYTMFGQKTNPKIEVEVHELLRKWESSDAKTLALWKKMNGWAYKGWKETYKKFGIKFDKEYYESQIYKKGKEIIMRGVEKGIFKANKKDKAVEVDLSKFNLGKKFLLRPDGTSVYITQDLYLAKKKFEEFKLTDSIYITGNEQDYHFQVLFNLLNQLGFKNNLKHLSYGMVTLPGGKIKSREGTEGISTDEIIEKVQSFTKKELLKREKLSKQQLEKRSLIIALAAIKYSLLKVDIKRNTLFNPKESINFEGDTGPYIQYSYARASSILRKAKTKDKNMKVLELTPKEIELVKKLSQFKEVILNSYSSLNPSGIANYSYQLAKIFNEFYHECPVIGSDSELFRISLVGAFRQVLKNSLNLLGIDVLEKM